MNAPRVCAFVRTHIPRPHEIDAHHIVPQSWGGRTVPGNLIDLCPNCHHNTHFLINEYVRAGGTPPKPAVRRYTALEQRLAAKAWANRPADHPPYTVTHKEQQP